MKKKRKGYIYVEVREDVRVDVDDVIEEIDDDDLLDELKKRGLIRGANNELQAPKSGRELRKLLCDICDLSYHSSDMVILDNIKERLL